MKRSFSDQAAAARGICSETDCLNPTHPKSGGRCWGHVKQLQRKGSTSALTPSRPQMTAIQRLRKDAIDYADASAEDSRDYKRAVDNLCAAAIGYAESRGWVRRRARA